MACACSLLRVSYLDVVFKLRGVDTEIMYKQLTNVFLSDVRLTILTLIRARMVDDCNRIYAPYIVSHSDVSVFI